jgi:signal transduction histidine kinase
VPTLDQIDLALLDALPNAVAVFDGEARLAGANQAYGTLMGLETRYIAGRPGWSDLTTRLRERRRLPEVPDPAVWRETERRRLVQLGGPVEDRLYLPDGRTLRCSAAPLPRGGFVLSYEDLTPRLDVERALNEAAWAQHQTLDQLADALAVFGGDGQLKFANAAFDTLWEWDGSRLADFLTHSRAPWPAARVLSRDAGEARMALPDGRVLEAAHLPLPAEATLLRYTDVTHALRLAEAERARNDALAAADRMKSGFIATLAGEVRTPLTSVLGFAELLAGSHAGPLNRRQQDYAEAIVKAGRGLARLIDGVLDLAQIDAGFAALERAPFDIHDALTRLTLTVAERARAAKIALIFYCAPDIGVMDGDARRIRQAVLHLLNNALAHSGAGGRITLAARRKDGWIEIEVADTGSGIARTKIAQMLDPFVRGEGAEGAGLGLSVVRRFVDMHGGDVKISSARHRGVKALLRLPAGAASG